MGNFEVFQKFGKDQLEAASSAATSVARGLQTIAAEATDYSKKSIEANSAYFEKLLGAKSLDNAVEVQSEYAKSAYEGFVAQATKIGDLYTTLAKDAFKPVESAIAKVKAASDLTGAEANAAWTGAQATFDKVTEAQTAANLMRAARK
jgi:hypothetical protein